MGEGPLPQNAQKENERLNILNKEKSGIDRLTQLPVLKYIELSLLGYLSWYGRHSGGCNA